MSIIHNVQIYTLSSISYNKTKIGPKSIAAFNPSTKSDNDQNNKMRENIIAAIIDKKIPDDYYIIYAWKRLHNAIFHYINEITENRPYTHIECKQMGGRRYNYDFVFEIYYVGSIEPNKYNIELKFNASNIADAPQFVSPMKPSEYLSKSYEEEFYDNYLPKLSNASGIPMPEKSVYMSQIHSNEPKCMIPFQELYYNGCSSSSNFTNNENHKEFYELAKRLSKESIEKFINETDLDDKKLSAYLVYTQKNKIYMLYKNNKFTLQRPNMEDYEIIKVIKNAKKSSYECESKNGKKINVLLRWKNGNGIAFPAFQIS